jgi:hypothetical protein
VCIHYITSEITKNYSQVGNWLPILFVFSRELILGIRQSLVFTSYTLFLALYNSWLFKKWFVPASPFGCKRSDFHLGSSSHI